MEKGEDGNMFTHNVYTVTVDQEVFLNVFKLVACKCDANTVHS